MRVRLFSVALAVALAVAGLAPLSSGSTVSAQQFSVAVSSDQLNVRSAPRTSAGIYTVLDYGDVVVVFDEVYGEEVVPGNSTWYQTRSGNYIYSGFTRPVFGQGSFSGPNLSGRWIDADLSTATVSAMEGNRVIYSAPSTVGTPDWPTPAGDFQILWRVLNETMDSETIGVPNDHPDGYYLTDVLYTQYFTEGGTALHYNYWSPDSAFGSASGSHGCLGLRLADARFFWNFATVGTPVIIHY